MDDQPGIPTQGLRFDGDNDAFKDGAAEVYTFTVRDFTGRSPNTGRVVAGRREYAFRLILLDPTCEVGVWPTPRPTPTLTPVPFSPLPTPTSTPDGGVVLPTEPVVAECVFTPPAGGMPPAEAIIPLDTYSFSEPQLVLTTTAHIQIEQWLPDSGTLLISSEPNISQTVSVALVNINTGGITEIVEPRRYLRKPRWLAEDRTVIWRELGDVLDSVPTYWEPGVQLRSFELLSTKRLSGNGNGAGVTHDVSPNGKEFVFLSLPGGTQPFLWNQVTKMLRALPVDLATWRYQTSGTPYPFQPFNVVWQPNNKKLLFWDGTWTFLYDLTTDSGCEIRIGTFIATPFTFVQEAAWSPNGRYLLLKNAEYPPYTMTSGPHDLVLILDTYTGEGVQYALGNLVVNLSWAPDNQTIAMTKKTGEETDSYGRFNLYDLFLFNGRSGETRQILPEQEGGDPKRPLWSPDGTLLAFLGTVEDKSGNNVSGVLTSRVAQSR